MIKKPFITLFLKNDPPTIVAKNNTAKTKSPASCHPKLVIKNDKKNPKVIGRKNTPIPKI